MKCRTLWLSDIHLGSTASSPDMVIKLLETYDADTIYLVGDIIDGWALKRRFWFPKSHLAVIKKIIKLSKKKKVIYIRGNHDNFLDDYLPLEIGKIDIVEEAIHISPDGKKYLVIHGDQFDEVVRYAKWLAWLGDLGYTVLVKANKHLNWFRKHLGMEYWSISAYMKAKVKIASNFIGGFEHAVAKAAIDRGLSGVICGHIHTPEIRMIDGILYANDGDVCETCSGLIEHEDGTLEIVYAKNL